MANRTLSPDDDADGDGEVLAGAGEEGCSGYRARPSRRLDRFGGHPGMSSIGTIIWIIVLTKEVRGSVAVSG